MIGMYLIVKNKQSFHYFVLVGFLGPVVPTPLVGLPLAITFVV